MPIDTVNPGQAGAAEAITFDSTSGGVAFTTGTITVNAITASRAVFVLEGASCRFTTDGTVPTTTVGTLINPGDAVTITSTNDVKNFRCIRTGATSGTAFVTYIR